MTLENRPFLSNLLEKGECSKMIENITQSINNNNKGKQCQRCGGQMKLIRQSEAFPYNVDDEKREMIVHHLPLHECKKCEIKVGDLLLYADIEEAIDKEIFLKLNKREEIPKEIEFEQLIN